MVKMVDPARETFVLVGDGSYLMLNSELATSVRISSSSSCCSTIAAMAASNYAPFPGALARIGYIGWIVVKAEQDPAIANPRVYQQVGLETLRSLAAEAGLAA